MKRLIIALSVLLYLFTAIMPAVLFIHERLYSSYIYFQSTEPPTISFGFLLFLFELGLLLYLIALLICFQTCRRTGSFDGLSRKKLHLYLLFAFLPLIIGEVTSIKFITQLPVDNLIKALAYLVILPLVWLYNSYMDIIIEKRTGDLIDIRQIDNVTIKYTYRVLGGEEAIQEVLKSGILIPLILTMINQLVMLAVSIMEYNLYG